MAKIKRDRKIKDWHDKPKTENDKPKDDKKQIDVNNALFIYPLS